MGGWWTALLNLLGMGGGAASAAADPVPRVLVPGADRTRVTLGGADRTRVTLGGADRTRVTIAADLDGS